VRFRKELGERRQGVRFEIENQLKDRVALPLREEFDARLPQLRVHAEAGTELEFVIMVIAVSCVKLLSAHNSTQHTSRKHKV
jgi:hypothetical protein